MKQKKKQYSIFDELFTLSSLKSFKDVFSVLSVRPESHGITLNYKTLKLQFLRLHHNIPDPEQFLDI